MTWESQFRHWLRNNGYELPKKEVGEIVISTYRARWKGIIIDPYVEGKENCVLVKITHDRHGNPVRKPASKCWLRTLDLHWLRKFK